MNLPIKNFLNKYLKIIHLFKFHNFNKVFLLDPNLFIFQLLFFKISLILC